MHNKIFFIWIFMFLSVCWIFANEVNVKKIGIEDFIKSSILNYPTVNINKGDLKAAEAQLKQAKAIHDTFFTAGVNEIYSRPMSSSLALSGTRVQNVLNSSIGILQVLPWSGTRMSAGFDMNYTSLKDAGKVDIDAIKSGGELLKIIDYKSFVPGLNFSITQPLLKNWIGLLDKTPIKQAKLNLHMKKEQVKELNEFYISTLYSKYFDWILTLEQLKIYKENYDNSLVLVEQIEKKYKSGVSEAVDFYKIKGMSLNYKKAVDQYSNLLISIEDDIKKYYSQDEIKISFEPDYQISENYNDYDIEFVEASNSRKMRILRFSLEYIENELKVERNCRMPELNLSFNGKWQGQKEDNGSFSGFKNDEYIIGLGLTYPFGDNQGKGKLKYVRNELDITIEKIKQFEIDYKCELRKMKRSILTMLTVLENDMELIKAMNAQVREEEKKYKQARSDLYFVIEAKNRLLETELDYITDRINFEKLYIQYLDITDSLYSKYF